MVGVSAGPAVADWDFRAVLAEYSKRWSQYIRERAGKEQPFFLYVPLTGPHKPTQPHERFRAKSGLGEYGDFVVQVDATVGRVLKALDRLETTRRDPDTPVPILP